MCCSPLVQLWNCCFCGWWLFRERHLVLFACIWSAEQISKQQPLIIKGTTYSHENSQITMQKPSPAPTDCIENRHIDIAPLYLHAKCKYNVEEPFLNHPCLFRNMLTLVARYFLSHSRTVCRAPSFAAVVFCWFSSSNSRAEICLGIHFLFLCEWSWAGRKQGQLCVPLLSRRRSIPLWADGGPMFC